MYCFKYDYMKMASVNSILDGNQNEARSSEYEEGGICFSGLCLQSF